MPALSGKTVLITGASRGIGKAIALRCARDGANVVVTGKTETPHPKLPGTIYTAAAEVEKAGGKALPVVLDVRAEEQVADCVRRTVETFGGLDVLVNNASAIHLAGVEKTPTKRFDLMFGINVRGTHMMAHHAIPHLRQASNPHILTLAPPLNLNPSWLAPHAGYTASKYSMSMLAIGMAGELAGAGIASNALWPRTTIATAAVEFVVGAELLERSRRPQIMGDAAYAIVTRPARSCTGNTFIDEDVLREVGIENFESYAVNPRAELQQDIFLD